jgi:hypothetical protein
MYLVSPGNCVGQGPSFSIAPFYQTRFKFLPGGVRRGDTFACPLQPVLGEVFFRFRGLCVIALGRPCPQLFARILEGATEENCVEGMVCAADEACGC